MKTARCILAALTVLMFSLGTAAQAGQMAGCMEAPVMGMNDGYSTSAGGDRDETGQRSLDTAMICYGSACIAPMLSPGTLQPLYELQTSFAIPAVPAGRRDRGPKPDPHPPKLIHHI